MVKVLVPAGGTTITTTWGKSVADLLNLTERIPWALDWKCDTTDPVLGNGAYNGWYIIVGDMVLASAKLYFGSSTTFGTGGMKWGLPVPAESGLTSPGHMSIFLKPSNAVRLIIPRFSDGTYFRGYLENTTASLKGETAGVWGFGGDISFTMQYPINR
jgi:hypothetical protein